MDVGYFALVIRRESEVWEGWLHLPRWVEFLDTPTGLIA